jgi:hypothetical protein
VKYASALSESFSYAHVTFGQSNDRPWGHRDNEGYVASPHLELSPSGTDLTIRSMAPLTPGAEHGHVGSFSLLTVTEVLTPNYYKGATVRMTYQHFGLAGVYGRRGHATVISNDFASLVVRWDSQTWTGSEVTFSGGNTAGDMKMRVKTTNPHLLPIGTEIYFTNSGGALPTGLVANQRYYVSVARHLVVRIAPDIWEFYDYSWTPAAHELEANDVVQFTTVGTLPPQLLAKTDYYVLPVNGTQFRVAATPGGPPIAFDAGVGDHIVLARAAKWFTLTNTRAEALAGWPPVHFSTDGSPTTTMHVSGTLYGLGGYVTLHDAHKFYANVKVLMPFQPEEMGPYPAGAPVVPGYDFAGAGITSYEDCGLFLEFTWDEGMDGTGGVGADGVLSAAGATLTSAGSAWPVGYFAGGYLRVEKAGVGGWAKIGDNTATTLTGVTWEGRDGEAVPPPADTTGYTFHIHVPHWRDNPHHRKAGPGFLYPSNDHMPAGPVYSRPKGQLVPSYVAVSVDARPCGTLTNESLDAQTKDVSGSNFAFRASLVNGKLRIERYGLNMLTINRTVPVQLIPFSDFLNKGAIVNIAGWDVQPGWSNINGNWIADFVEPPGPARIVPISTPSNPLPLLVTWQEHELPASAFIMFRTNGVLPLVTSGNHLTAPAPTTLAVEQPYLVVPANWQTNGDTDLNLAANTFTKVAHGFQNDDHVTVTSSGAFPAANPPLQAGHVYWVEVVTPDTFRLSTTPSVPGFTAVDLTGTQAGVTLTFNRLDKFGLVSAFAPLDLLRSISGQTAAVTFDNGTERMTWNAHNLPNATPLTFSLSGGTLPTRTTFPVTITLANPAKIQVTNHGRQNGDRIFFTTAGTLPASIVANVRYFIVNRTNDDFEISATQGGPPISTLGQSQVGATHTGNPAFDEGVVYYSASVTANDMRLASSAALAAAGQPDIIFSANGAATINATVAHSPTGQHFAYTHGSYVDLIAYDANLPVPSTPPLPFSINTMRIANVIRFTAHRFGKNIEEWWRLACTLGLTLHTVNLGVNSSGQYLASRNNLFGLQGELGWWNDDNNLDWTPSNSKPRSNFNRLKKMITVIGPGALKAAGIDKPLRFLSGAGFQGEADALTAVGRDMYAKTLPVFWNTIRQIINEAGLSPYGPHSKMPVLHARIRHEPYELTGTFPGYGGEPIQLAGDDQGVVNAAIENWVLFDQWAATLNPNDHPVLDGVTSFPFAADPLHFNGFGEVMNGSESAALLLPMIDEALSSSLQPDDLVVLEICNLALGAVGDGGKITSLDPEHDGTRQAELCRVRFPRALALVLQRCSFSFATRRGYLTAITPAHTGEWEYAYLLPVNCARMFAVQQPDSGDDYAHSRDAGRSITLRDGGTRRIVDETSGYVPEDFAVEKNADGTILVLTNVGPEAVGRWNAFTADTSEWTPYFIEAVVFQLAAMLPGPLVTGTEGVALSEAMLKRMEYALAHARVQDAIQAKSDGAMARGAEEPVGARHQHEADAAAFRRRRGVAGDARARRRRARAERRAHAAQLHHQAARPGAAASGHRVRPRVPQQRRRVGEARAVPDLRLRPLAVGGARDRFPPRVPGGADVAGLHPLPRARRHAVVRL